MTSCFHHTRPLVLASTSPRRQMFLRDLGLNFTVVVGDGPEPTPSPGEDPESYTLRTAEHKARAALALLTASGGVPLSPCDKEPRAPLTSAPMRAQHKHAVVLAADTIVVLNDDILGKPTSEEHAVTMLKRMSGRTHTVITACCLASADMAEPCRFADHTRVTFAAWPESLLRAYVATGEPMDKAGAYGIQGKGSFLVERMEGSWSTVVGLPVSLVVDTLLRLDALRLLPA